MADRTWQPDGPHRWVLRMGPIKVDVQRWSYADSLYIDEWFFEAWTSGAAARIVRGHFHMRGAPLAQCQADAIAAVEAWRDSIR